MSIREHLSDSIKKQVAGKQLYQCANSPTKEVDRLEDYNCPLWYSSKHYGNFDEAGFDIDHIKEYSLTQDHSMENLQALCKSCHSVKTKRFMNEYKKIKKEKKVKQVEKNEDTRHNKREELKEYEDIYEQFLNECTLKKNNSRIKTSRLYKTFKIWWKENNSTKPIGRNNFLKGMMKHTEIKKMRFAENIVINGIINHELLEKYKNYYE